MKRLELRHGTSLATAQAHYRIKSRISAGANGVVYRALAEDSTPVAVKLFSPRDPVDEAQRETLRKSFRNEVKKTRRARHWAVIRILDTGTATIRSKRVPFVVMEYAPHSLRDLIRDNRLGSFAACFYSALLCETTEYINSRGQIHRDIKPENILVDDSSLLKVADLGIAEIVADFEELMLRDYSIYHERPDSRHPRHYFSPEQLRRAAGDSSADLARSDVFQVGKVIHEMFTGINPVGQLHLKTPASKDMPLRVHDLVCRMLAEQPDDRPPLAQCSAFLYREAGAAIVTARRTAERLTRRTKATFAQWFETNDRFDPDTSPTFPEEPLTHFVRAGLIRAESKPHMGIYQYVTLTRKGRDVRDLLLNRPSLRVLVDLYRVLRRMPAPSLDHSRLVPEESLVFCEKRVDDWPAWVVCPPFHLGTTWWIEVFEGNIPFSQSAVPGPRQWPVPYGAPRHIVRGTTLGTALRALRSVLLSEGIPSRRAQRSVTKVRLLSKQVPAS